MLQNQGKGFSCPGCMNSKNTVYELFTLEKLCKYIVELNAGRELAVSHFVVF